MIMQNLLVKFSNAERGFFKIEIPSYWGLDKFTRDDIALYIKDNSGHWFGPGCCWRAPVKNQGTLFRVFTHVYEAKVIVPLTEPTILTPEVPEDMTIFVPPAPKIQVQVPVAIVAPKPSKTVDAIVARQYEKIRKALLQLHEDTGVNKTIMRQLLSETVPAQRNLVVAPS